MTKGRPFFRLVSMSLYSDVKRDFEVYKERDPAIRTYWDVLLYPCVWAIRA